LNTTWDGCGKVRETQDLLSLHTNCSFKSLPIILKAYVKQLIFYNIFLTRAVE